MQAIVFCVAIDGLMGVLVYTVTSTLLQHSQTTIPSRKLLLPSCKYLYHLYESQQHSLPFLAVKAARYLGSSLTDIPVVATRKEQGRAICDNSVNFEAMTSQFRMVAHLDNMYIPHHTKLDQTQYH